MATSFLECGGYGEQKLYEQLEGVFFDLFWKRFVQAFVQQASLSQSCFVHALLRVEPQMRTTIGQLRQSVEDRSAHRVTIAEWRRYRAWRQLPQPSRSANVLACRRAAQ